MGEEYVYSRSSCGSGAYRMKKSVYDRLCLEEQISDVYLEACSKDLQLRQFPIELENNVRWLVGSQKQDFIKILKNEIGGINNE